MLRVVSFAGISILHEIKVFRCFKLTFLHILALIDCWLCLTLVIIELVLAHFLTDEAILESPLQSVDSKTVAAAEFAVVFPCFIALIIVCIPELNEGLGLLFVVFAVLSGQPTWRAGGVSAQVALVVNSVVHADLGELVRVAAAVVFAKFSDSFQAIVLLLPVLVGPENAKHEDK